MTGDMKQGPREASPIKNSCGRPVGTRLMLMVTAVILGGAGILDSVNPGVTAINPLIIASIIALSFWGVHFFLVIRKIPGDEYLLPLSTFLISLGWLEIFRLRPDDGIRQLYWILAGEALLVLWLVLVRDYRALEDYKYLFLVGAVLLQGAVAIFGHEVNGARLWFNFGFFSIQPVEFVKIFLTIFLVSYLKQNRSMLEKPLTGKGAGLLRYYIPLFVLWGVAESVLIIQRDLGMALLLFGVFMGLMYIITRQGSLIALGFSMAAVSSVVFYNLFGHVRVRINNWWNPWASPEGWGYQIVQSLYALANGGILGAGLGRGEPYYIPAVHTDYIFVALCEELGLVGGFIIIGVFLVLAERMFRISLGAKDEFSTLLASGLAILFSTQVFIIIAGSVKMIPLTGITLPFVSYGGSSLVSNFLMLGLLMQISAGSHDAGKPEVVGGEGEQS